MSETETPKFVEKVRTGQLLDLYGGLLSDRQSRILRLYCDEDFGFSEIAEELEISRQAVYDATRQARDMLEKFEGHLGLLKGGNGSANQLDSDRIQSLFESIMALASQQIIYDTRPLRMKLQELREALFSENKGIEGIEIQRD